MVDAATPNDLDHKVAQWLSSQGYPLEFEAAHELGRAGLKTRLGMFFDEPGGSPREIDVVGFTEPASPSTKGFTNISAQVVVECKWSRKSPWVILSQNEARTYLEGLGMTILTRDAQLGWMEYFITPGCDLAHFDFVAFPSTNNMGYSVVPALRDGNDDRPYRAITKVVSAARAIADKPTQPFRELQTVTGVPIQFWHWVVPCIVLDGPLYIASYAPTNLGFELRRVSHGRINWMANGPTGVSLVTREAFPEFAQGLTKIMTRFVEVSSRIIKLRAGEAA